MTAEPRPINLDKSQVLTLRQVRRLTLTKEIKGDARHDPAGRLCVVGTDHGLEILKPIRCPFGAIGDRWWVREQWWHLRHAGGDDLRTATYCADYAHPPPTPEEGQRWVKRPPSAMPSWASRFTLEVAHVRWGRAAEESPWYWTAELMVVDS